MLLAFLLPSCLLSCSLEGGRVLDSTESIRSRTVQDETFQAQGYRVVRYELGSEHETSLVSPDGEPAHFLMAAPVLSEPDFARPILLLLHGGCMDVDNPEQPEGVDGTCGTEYGRATAANVLLSDIAHIFAEKGAIIIAPENAACDAWVGEGDADPADTAHIGFALASFALDFVQNRQSDHVIDENALYVVGTSIGAQGSVWFARSTPGITALLFDSGSGDMVRYYQEDDYIDQALETRQARLDHVLGGPPYQDELQSIESEWFERYHDLSIVRQLREGEWSIPVFQAWNNLDPLSPPSSNDEMALELANAGVRTFNWDVSHTRPIHGQLTSARLSPVIWAATRFAEGAQVRRIEAEDPTSLGQVGEVIQGVPATEDASGDSVRISEIGESGQLLVLPLPAIPSGVSLSVNLWGGAYGKGDPEEIVAALQLVGAKGTLAQRSLTLNDLTGNESTSYFERASSFQALTLETVTDTGPLFLRLDVSGSASVWADVVTMAW